MDEHTQGIGLFGYIILFVIIVWVFGSMFGGNGFNFNGRQNSYDMGFEDYKAICEAEKANITQTATTQYMIQAQGNETRSYLGTKIDFYEYQNLRDKLNERDMVIAELKNKLFVKDELAPLTATLSNIQCNMLRRPDVTGIGVACPSAAILNGLGVNSLNNCNSCSNGVII